LFVSKAGRRHKDCNKHWTELADGWKLASADQAQPDEAVSTAEFDASRWHPVRHMPATVLQILEDHGIYKDLLLRNLVTPWRRLETDKAR